MNLADILGDGSPHYDRPPYRPQFCPCCGGGLGWDVVVFCRRCELHREWCQPLRSPVLSRKEVPGRYPYLVLVK